MATTYIQFTGRLKATSQEGILAEAQQVAISSTDNTNVKDYIDKQIAAVKGNISSVAGSVYRPKGSLTVANFKALTSAAVGDVYNITEQFTLSGRTYPAYTNVACVKAFSAAVTPDDSYWDALGGTVDLSPYAKTADVNTKVDTINKSISDNVSSLTTKISTAQSTANTANDTANANKTNISWLTTRVSTLEGSDHVNKINTVKVNGTALTPDGNKAVNIDISGKVDKNGDDYMNVKHAADWCGSYVLGDQTGSKNPFLRYRVDTEGMTLKIGNMLDGFTYAENVSIPLIDDTNGVFFDPYYYREYIQPLFNDEYALQTTVDNKVDKEEGKGLSTNDFTTDEKNKLAGIASGANKYVLPAATASALGGVKVGQVYASGTILPTVATVNLRASDNMAVVPAATTSAAGVMTAADKTKLNGIAGGAQVNVIEKVYLNGAELTPNSEKKLTLGTLITDSQFGSGSKVYNGVIIGNDSSTGTERVYIGSNTKVFCNAKIGTNTEIGDGVHVESGYLSVSSGGILYYGTGSASTEVARQSEITLLQSRVTALENLLKLA